MMNLGYIHFDNFKKISKNHKSLKIVKISTFWLPQVAALHTTATGLFLYLLDKIRKQQPLEKLK